MDHDHTRVGEKAEREYKELLKSIEPNILTTKSLKLPRRDFVIEIKPSCSNLKQTHHKPACYPSLRVIDITTWYYTTVIIVANDSCESRGGGSSRRRRDGSMAGGRDGGAIPYFDWDCAPTPVGFGVSQANDSVEGRGESSGRQEGGSGAASVGEGRDGSTGGGGGGDEGGGEGIGGSIGGGGGHGEGNGDDGGDEGRGSRGFNVEDGRGERNSRRTMDISRIAEIFIAVIAQSTAAVIALHYFSGLSSGNRDLLVCVLVTNLVGFVCCMAAIWQSHTSTRASGILGMIGSAAASLGFILMIAMILPPYLVWMIGLACLALLVVFVLSFMPFMS